MKKDNRIIVDLNKVQWARFGYRNQYGDFRNIKPPTETAFNQVILPDAILYGSMKESCTGVLMLDHARKNKILDIWTPEVKFKLTAHECLIYTGDKAVSLYKAWCENIFKKGEKK